MSHFESDEMLELTLGYEKTWKLLLAYDEGRLELPHSREKIAQSLSYERANSAIGLLKSHLKTKSEAGELFGKERNGDFQSILQNLEQTFDGKALYPSIEEKAAHLLYFIIKDHPFVDGNKRIGSFIFLFYLKIQGIRINLDDNGLVALSLFVAESNPTQKDIIIRLIVNLII